MLINQYDDGSQKPIARWEEGEMVIRASALGACRLRLAKHLQGFHEASPDFTTKIAANKGKMLEPLVVDFIRENGFHVDGSQTIFNLQTPHGTVVGAADGIITRTDPGAWRVRGKWNGEPTILEIKTRNEAKYEKTVNGGPEAIPRMLIQGYFYASAAGVPGVLFATVRRKQSVGDTLKSLVLQYREVPGWFVPWVEARMKGLRELYDSESLVCENDMYCKFSSCPNAEPPKAVKKLQKFWKKRGR